MPRPTDTGCRQPGTHGPRNLPGQDFHSHRDGNVTSATRDGGRPFTVNTSAHGRMGAMSNDATPSPVPSRRELIDNLTLRRIAGKVATPRENNLAHYRELAQGNRHFWLGLELGDRWTDENAVLELMAARCGVNADPAYRSGQDTIDPELTVDALDRMAVALRKAAGAGDPVLVATGHPGGLLPVHQAVAKALRKAGCDIITLAGPTSDEIGGTPGLARKLLTDNDDEIRQINGVMVLHRTGNLLHTHSPEPMTLLLNALEQNGLALPELVFADHGWAGCAGQRGIETVGFADSNDPALFIGEAEGQLISVVPLDDNVCPNYYGPMTNYLLNAAGLPGEEG